MTRSKSEISDMIDNKTKLEEFAAGSNYLCVQ